MNVQSIRNIWDSVYDRYRKTVYTTFVDQKTHKTYVEAVEHLYTKNGVIKLAQVRGKHIDVQA